jgi:hypothetical protein
MQLRYGSGAEARTVDREQLEYGRMGGTPLPTYAEIIGKYPSLSAATCVFAAGSLVLGWAHAASDLDLYVLSEQQLVPGGELESFVRHVSTEDPVIRIVIAELGPYRADMEFWRTVQIDEIIGRFAAGVPSQDAPELDKGEQDLIYRLVTGRPLHGQDWWESRRDAVLRSGYGRWLAENRKLIAETYLEDVGGLLRSGDVDSAVLAAQEAFAGALEAALAMQGDYSINRKWLSRRLQRHPLPDITPEQAWAVLVMKDATDDLAGWAEATGRTAQRLLLSVERVGG